EFEVPLPSAKFAVFPPQFRELPKPHLELFDLEEEFASERVALIKTDYQMCVQLIYYISTNAEDELESFVQESGEILGINALFAQDASLKPSITEYLTQESDAKGKIDQNQFDYFQIQYGGHTIFFFQLKDENVTKVSENYDDPKDINIMKDDIINSLRTDLRENEYQKSI
ncbi:MAG: hypothetical protein EZS28_028392, partial [Streblomastix strix]